jgi:hypothetical protein
MYLLRPIRSDLLWWGTPCTRQIAEEEGWLLLQNVLPQQGAVGTDGKKLTAEEKKSNCNWSTMACVEYDEQVCHVCWEKGCNA